MLRLMFKCGSGKFKTKGLIAILEPLLTGVACVLASKLAWFSSGHNNISHYETKTNCMFCD